MEPWLLITLAFPALAVIITSAVSIVPAIVLKRKLKSELASATRGRLALTYDDGPGPLLGPPLLELLARHGAQATFFLVGFRAERFSSAVDELQRAGHELGNHTHWHRHAWRSWPWRAVRDMREGYQTLSRWISHSAPFRPPFGKLTYWIAREARSTNAPLCFWTHDGGDTWPALPDPRTIAEGVARDGGGVVLLHSHDRGADRQQYVLQVTQCLLETARTHGLTVCTMTQAMQARP